MHTVHRCLDFSHIGTGPIARVAHRSSTRPPGKRNADVSVVSMGNPDIRRSPPPDYFGCRQCAPQCVNRKWIETSLCVVSRRSARNMWQACRASRWRSRVRRMTSVCRSMCQPHEGWTISRVLSLPWVPLRDQLSIGSSNQRSTRFIQEPQVGVKRRVKRGCRRVGAPKW